MKFSEHCQIGPNKIHSITETILTVLLTSEHARRDTRSGARSGEETTDQERVQHATKMTGVWTHWSLRGVMITGHRWNLALPTVSWTNHHRLSTEHTNQYSLFLFLAELEDFFLFVTTLNLCFKLAKWFRRRPDRVAVGPP